MISIREVDFIKHLEIAFLAFGRLVSRRQKQNMQSAAPKIYILALSKNFIF
jgi:hypothetical protein